MTCPVRRHIRQLARRSQLWKNTDLGLSEDGQENALGVILGAPQSNEQKRVYSVKSTRLGEHHDDSLAHSATFSLSHNSADTSGVQNEPDDNHEGEEDVERN